MKRAKSIVLQEYEVQNSFEKNATTGNNIIDIAPTDILNLPKGIKVVRVSPPTIEISFDKANTRIYDV